MTQQEFEDRLRQFISTDPFVPFVVERLDGTLLEITGRPVVFNGGAATHVTPDFEFLEFACEDVRAIRAAPRRFTMTPEQFDETLRKFLRREPFEPFVVERLDGTLVEVKIPKLAFGGGVAGFLSDDDGIVSFDYDEVRAIRSAKHETAS